MRSLCAAVGNSLPFLAVLLLLDSPLSWMLMAASVFGVWHTSSPRVRFNAATYSTRLSLPVVYRLASGCSGWR